MASYLLNEDSFVSHLSTAPRSFQEDADETQSQSSEAHVPGLNLEFLRQLVSLAKIMVPGFRSHEVALLSVHTLCLFSRTFLSIYVASLEGSIGRHYPFLA